MEVFGGPFCADEFVVNGLIGRDNERLGQFKDAVFVADGLVFIPCDEDILAFEMHLLRCLHLGHELCNRAFFNV